MTDRAEFLADLIDLDTARFHPRRKRVPHSSRVAEFQKIVDRYVQANTLVDVPRATSFLRVLDVARKKGSGTASLGLDRLFVLVEGWDLDPRRSVILEMTTPDARHFAGWSRSMTSPRGRRLWRLGVGPADCDPLYGFAEIDG